MKTKKLLAFLLSLVIIFTGLPVIAAQASDVQYLGGYYRDINSTNYTKAFYGDFTVPSRGVVKFIGNRLFDGNGAEQNLSFKIYKSTDLNNPIWDASNYNFESSTEDYSRLIALGAGTYRFEVQPSMYSSAFSSGKVYKFNFDFYFAPYNCYEIEPNNNKTNANVLTYDTPVYAYADKSEDYYSVTVSKDTPARIKIKNYTALRGASTYIKFLPADNSSAQYLSEYNAGVGSDHYYFDVMLKKGTNHINVTSVSKGQVDYSIEVSKNIVIPAPVIKNLKISGTKVEVSWNQLSGVSGYEIWRKINKGNWELVLNASSNAIGFWQSGTNFKNTYQFKIKAYKTVGNTKIYSSWSKIKALNPTPTNIKLSASSYTYDGKTKTPKVVVKNKNGITLKKGVDYTVSYASGRKAIGKYKVTITFKGDYSGKKNVYFNINPKPTSVSSVSAAKKSLKVKIKSRTSQTSGYQVQYSTSKKFSGAKTTTIKSNKTTSVTLKSLKANKTYYVRVRTYKTVNGTKYYSSWSSYKTKKTK